MEVIDEEEKEAATKIVQADVILPLLLQIKYFDFEGRSDGRSIRNIISHIAPRKVSKEGREGRKRRKEGRKEGK